MPNKINIDKVSGFSPIRAAGQGDVKKSGGETAKQAEVKKVSEDKVEFSDRATEVGNYVKQIKNMPDTREEKVSKLKEQVSSGTYQPSGNDIADAILKDENIS
jgi:flagellar biosynthesis anti-sigma factor FlgM